MPDFGVNPVIESHHADGRISRTVFHHPDPNGCWVRLRDEVVDSPERERIFEEVEEAFRELGDPRGLILSYSFSTNAAQHSAMETSTCLHP